MYTYTGDNIVSDEWLNAPDCAHGCDGPCTFCDSTIEDEI